MKSENISGEVIHTSFPNLHAGSAPAAAILVGAFFAAGGQGIGWLILIGGFGLSVLWALCR